ncbi:putative odorant receptor [Trypoxylus dichotomus]
MANERKYLRVIDTIQLVLPVSVIMAAMFFMLRPLYHANRLFILEALLVDSTVINTIVLAFQYYSFLLAGPLVVGYDSLYFASCVHLVVHVIRLKYKLEDLSRISTRPSVTRGRLIYCIKHHQFLIRTLQKMQGMFSVTLLFHYFVTLLSGCIVLYELIGSAEHNIEQVLNVFVVLAQFGYYAFPAGQVASEFDELSTSLFVSGWHQQPPAFQRLVLFAMVRSQKKEQFVGGGVVPINEDTFGSVSASTFCEYAREDISFKRGLCSRSSGKYSAFMRS